MPPAEDDIIRITARLNNPLSGDMVNVFTARVENVLGLTDAQLIAGAAQWCNDMWDDIDNWISDEFDYVDVNCFNITQNTPLGSTGWPTLVSGANSNPVMPTQLAAFVRGLTGLSKSWARKFLGGFTESSNTAFGFVEPGTLTDLATWVVEWLAGYAIGGAGDLVPVVFHDKTASWKDVVEGVLSNVWATFRTRKPGRGS